MTRRISRSEASRKGWVSRRRLAAAKAARMRAFAETGAPIIDEDPRPGGPIWGTKPLDPETDSVPAILARLRAAAGAGG